MTIVLFKVEYPCYDRLSDFNIDYRPNCKQLITSCVLDPHPSTSEDGRDDEPFILVMTATAAKRDVNVNLWTIKHNRYLEQSAFTKYFKISL